MPLPETLQSLVDRIGGGSTADKAFASAIGGVGAALADLRQIGASITKGSVELAGDAMNDASVAHVPDIPEDQKPGYVDLAAAAAAQAAGVAEVAKGDGEMGEGEAGGESSGAESSESGEDVTEGCDAMKGANEDAAGGATNADPAADVAKGEPALEPVLEASDLIKGIADTSAKIDALQEENALLKSEVAQLRDLTDRNAAHLTTVLDRLGALAAGQEAIAKGLAGQGEALGSMLADITKGMGEHYLLNRERSAFPSGQGRTGRFDDTEAAAPVFRDEVLLKGIGENVLTHDEMAHYRRARGVFSVNPQRHAEIVARLITFN